MCEFAMHYWHVSPTHVLRHWTRDFLVLMVEMCNRRVSRAAKQDSGETEPMSMDELRAAGRARYQALKAEAEAKRQNGK